MTVSELCHTAGALPGEAPVLIYLDQQAEIMAVNDVLVAGVEGYFSATAEAEGEALILTAGEPDG